MKKEVIQLLEFPKVTTQQYDEVMADLRAIEKANPRGRLYHAAGSKPEGGLIIVNVWESKEDFEEFTKTLLPILSKHGLPQLQPSFYSAHNIIAAIKEETVG